MLKRNARIRMTQRRHRMEFLESRVLMTVSAVPFTEPGVFPLAAAYNPADGHLWVVDGNSLTLQDLDGTASFDVSATTFNSNFVITGGFAYLGDGSGGIDQVDLGTGNINFFHLTNDVDQTPTQLTVSGSAIWFNTQGSLHPDNLAATNYVGRWSIGSGSADFLALGGTLSDSQNVAISASGADGAWIGMDGLDNENFSGSNHLVQVSFTSGNFSTTAVIVNSANATSNINNHLTAVASDTTGGVWYALASRTVPGTLRAGPGADVIVHLSGASQATFNIPNTSNAVTNVINFAVGQGDRLWFNEQDGPQAGYVNMANGAIEVATYPGGTEMPFAIAASPLAVEAVVLTAPSASEAPIIQLTVVGAPADVPLNLTSFSVTPLILRAVLLTATFTDDPGLPTSTFTATINWGDNTSSTGAIVADPTQAGRYLVLSAHRYRRHGTFTATITITTTESGAVITNNTASQNVTV